MADFDVQKRFPGATAHLHTKQTFYGKSEVEQFVGDKYPFVKLFIEAQHTSSLVLCADPLYTKAIHGR